MPDDRERFQRALEDRYVLERELGQGGMATVFLARDVRQGRRVAIKFLRPELASSLGPERFMREIEIVSRLTHPNVLPLHDSGASDDGLLYYVMPFVDGESLRDRLRRERQLPIDDALRIARETAAALDYAHRRGIVHRDVKPDNVLLADGHVLVADFGIARAVDGTAGGDTAPAAGRLTATGLAVGTAAYMSPEQATGGAVDGRSDVYSLGCVVYEMLAGEPPFAASSAQAMLARRLTDTLPPLRTLRETVPDSVERAVARALARTPADRFATAGEFARALAEPGPTTAAAAAGAARPASSRRRAAVAALAAVVLVAAGLGLWRLRARGTDAGVSVSRLAVLPFAAPPAPASAAYLGEGMVDLLSRSLDGAPGVHTIDPGTVLRAVGKGSDGESLDRGRALARRLGAGLFVLGSVHASGARLRVQAALYDGTDSTSDDPDASATAEGDSAQLFELVDRVSRELLAARSRGVGARLTRIAALTSASLPAMKDYLSGERWLRAASFDSAIAAFQHAVATDSTFALAYYRLAVSYAWSGRAQGAGPASERALALADRLGVRDRELLSAFAEFRRGRADEAERRYRTVLRDYPDDVEAEFQLADVLFHYNPVRGRPRAESADLFDRVLATDPKFLCPI